MSTSARSTTRRCGASGDSQSEVLLKKNPVVLDAAKNGYRHAAEMSWEGAQDNLYAKLEQSQFQDRSGGRQEGLSQFLDEKTIRPGLQGYGR